MKTDTDDPPEQLPTWFELVDWFASLWSRTVDRLHRWIHRRMPECPKCAANLQKADNWADNYRRAEELLAADRAKGDTGPVTDAEIAVATDTLLTGQTPRLPQPPNINQLVERMISPPTPAAPELPKESHCLTYAELIASREPRPLVRFPKSMIDEVRGRVHTVVRADCQTIEMCHRRDGRPAITTAEIVARAQEMVDAREEQQ